MVSGGGAEVLQGDLRPAFGAGEGVHGDQAAGALVGVDDAVADGRDAVAALAVRLGAHVAALAEGPCRSAVGEPQGLEGVGAEVDVVLVGGQLERDRARDGQGALPAFRAGGRVVEGQGQGVRRARSQAAEEAALHRA
ncbi:hypothetical protein GCM10020254_24550 [Streptomyces goshikiensis]